MFNPFLEIKGYAFMYAIPNLTEVFCCIYVVLRPKTVKKGQIKLNFKKDGLF